MGSKTNWSWVTARGGWTLMVNLEDCTTQLAFTFTWWENHKEVRRQTTIQDKKNRNRRNCQSSESCTPTAHLYGYWRDRQTVDILDQSLLYTDTKEMINWFVCMNVVWSHVSLRVYRCGVRAGGHNSGNDQVFLSVSFRQYVWNKQWRSFIPKPLNQSRSWVHKRSWISKPELPLKQTSRRLVIYQAHKCELTAMQRSNLWQLSS